MRPMHLLLLFAFTAAPAAAQDPVKVDPKHYSVVSENSKVRILRVVYAPHEKSVMHSHPDLVAVFLTDASLNFELAGGKTEKREGKAGDALWIPAEKHLPENVGDNEARVILIEMKHPPAAAAKKK